ncbi:MAG TPA: tetratricopeptide repeat protein [Skermanella sp.]|nr:tetratricopeptide repeat protein [Skermanella sp.]
MKNLVIVLKRSVLAGLLGSGIGMGLTGLGFGGAAWAVTPDRPMPASVLDESITATGSYLAGRHAQQTDDWPAAAEFMGRALAIDPQNTGLLRRIYLLRLGDGKMAEAVELARQVTVVEPGNHLAKLLLAADDANAGRFDDAGRRLAGASDDGLARFVEPILRAWIAVAKGDGAGAQAALAPIENAQGFSILHHFHAGLIAEYTGDPVKAESWFLKSLGSGAPLRIIQAVGGFFERAGKTEEAKAFYESFRDSNPDTLLLQPELDRLSRGEKPAPIVASPRDGMAEALFDIASALNQEGAGDMALMYGRIALHLRGDLSLARMMVGDILQQRGLLADALVQYGEVKGDAALQWTARLRSAGVLERMKRGDEAVGLLTAMAAERPDRSDALVELGDIHRGAERYEQAIAAYGDALTRIGTLQPRHWVILYARAMTYDKLKRWEDAERDLLRANDLSPDQAFLLNYLGYSWIDRGVNLERGKAMIQRAVELKPTDGYIIDSLGWALYRMEDFAGAVTNLERAVELKPLDPTINDHLGDAYWQVGREAEARFQWRRALLHAEENDMKSAINGKLENGLPRNRTAASQAIPK